MLLLLGDACIDLEPALCIVLSDPVREAGKLPSKETPNLPYIIIQAFSLECIMDKLVSLVLN